MEDKKRRIDDLVNMLNECNRLYYVECKPVISDFEFDTLLKELQTLERVTGYVLPYSPTQRVGSDLQSGFSEVDRTRIMGSIENTYDLDELKKWIESVASVDDTLLLEPKYDGLSLSLIYKGGILVEASTRGNGFRGTDVTLNAKTIKSIPMKLAVNECAYTGDWHYEGLYVPDEVEVRGEVLMSKTEFARLNAEREAAGLGTFANERNAAAGSLKQLDPAVTAERNLIFRPYTLYSGDADFNKKYLTSHHSGLDIANIFGFTEPAYWRCADAKTVCMFVREFEDRFLKTQDFCMDGCVIKLDSVSKQDELGYTQKVPRWARAFKFKQPSASSKLNDVVWQVSREGKLSPVAIIDPVDVDGTTISSVYLNNMDYINSNGVKLGAYVFVERGGGVIPKITGVDENRTDFTQTEDIEEPSYCPCCGSRTERKLNDGASVYCTNKLCPDRLLNKVLYFTSKNCMNIKHLGSALIGDLVDSHIVKDWQDLYALSEDVLMPITGAKMAAKICAEIEASRHRPADVILASIGAPMCGRVTASKLISEYGSISAVIDSAVSGTLAADGVGEVASKMICEFFQENPDTKMLIESILVPEYESAPESISNKLDGKLILATGTLEGFTRDGISESIVANGGKVASSVSKKLDYLLVGSAPGSSKVEKAKSLGIRMITESEYMDMIR